MRVKKHRRSKFLFREERNAPADVQRKAKNAAKFKKRHTATQWVFIQKIEEYDGSSRDLWLRSV